MAAPRKLWRVKSNRPRARTKISSVPSFINVKTPLFSSEGDQNRSFEGLLWGPVQNNKLDGPWACPRTILSEETSRPITPAQANWSEENTSEEDSSSDVPKSRSMMHPSYCSLYSKHIKRKKAQNIPAKAVTTTLNALQLLSWPH